MTVALTIVVFGVLFTAVAAMAHYAASRITPGGNNDHSKRDQGKPRAARSAPQ
jgi:hypothetical protein